MAFDGSGNYVPPSAPAFPAVGGQTIAAAYYNQVINDIAAALSVCITRDGQGKPTANMDWNGKNLTNVAALACVSLSVTNGMGVASGGTGVTAAPTNGQILVGNGSGYVLANIAGSGGIGVTNGAGTIALAISGDIASSGFTTPTGVLIGRSTAGIGALEHITIGAGLSLSGGVLAATGGGSISLANLTIDNSGSGVGSGSTYNGSVGVRISWNTVGAQPLVPRQQSTASSATITPDATNDIVTVTALAANITIANPTGSPSDGQGMIIRLRDNGTPRTIGFGTAYSAVGVTLPTTTVSNKWLYIGIVYNATTSIWDVIGVQQQ